MTGLFSTKHPPFRRVLLIESGDRQAANRFLTHLYRSENCPQVDILTCFRTLPEAFEQQRGRVFLVTDPAIAGNRPQFIRAIASTPYDVVAVLHTGSRIMRNWKWAIGLLTRAKIVLVKENADFFGLNCAFLLNFNTRVHVPRLRREHIAGVRLAGESLLLPFVVSYLLLYAGGVHLRRLLRN